MAALVDGAYEIISVQSGKAVVVGSSKDVHGQNIILWTLTHADGQLWYVSRPEGTNQSPNRYMISSSLSCRVMGASSAKKKGGTRNVIQVNNTNDKAAQRWIITSLNKNHTYGGKSYPVYTIKWVGSKAYGLDVEKRGTNNGANIGLAKISSNPGTNQQWIFVPVDNLKNAGFYKISPVSTNGVVLGIASASKSHGAQCVLQSDDSTAENQVFFIKKQTVTGNFYFEAAHSGLHLDVWGGASQVEAGKKPYVNQGKIVGGAANQLWFVERVPGANGTVKRGGTSYPVYEVRTAAGANNNLGIYRDGKTTDKRAYVGPRSGSHGNAAQHFLFIPTEGYSDTVAQPAALTPTSFSRSGSGTLTVSGLTFKSTLSTFQARYRLITYTSADMKTKTTGSWMSIKDDSTARGGWGPVNAVMFTCKPVNGVVTLPFTKTFTLNNSDIAIDIEIQVRGFITNYKKWYKAHGPARSTTIRLRQNPTISVSRFSLVSESDNLYVGGNLIYTPPTVKSTSVRARLLSADRKEILSDYVVNFSDKLRFPVKEMKRLPNDDEEIRVEYEAVTVNGSVKNGAFNAVFENCVTGNVGSLRKVTNTSSCVVRAYVKPYQYQYCFVMNQDISGERLHLCPRWSSEETENSYYVFPSLNKDCQIIILSSDDNKNWYRTTDLTCRLNSHNFMWNWRYTIGDGFYDDYAILMVNDGAPPQQTRTFKSDITFESPLGRLHPVAFSRNSLTTDMSVDGIVVDKDANYISAEPLPTHSGLDYLRQLILLSGQGIHPIYRNPYGDIYEVGIENIDLSKTALGYTSVRVTQRVVDD